MSLRTIRHLCLSALLLFAASAAAAEEAVDLELVLAVDVSGSMDREEQLLQRAGYVEAIHHPDVIAAIRSGLHGRIALTYTEWAGDFATRVVVPWQLIADEAAAQAFAETLAAAPISSMRGTSISSGLRHAAEQFGENGYRGLRRVIDISGDGPNNMGPPVVPQRDELVAAGIVINGLPITLKPSNNFGTPIALDEYYRNCVIGGPGAFTVPVNAPDMLTEAIRRKLVLEIADLTAGNPYAVTPVADPGFNCQTRPRPTWYDDP